MSLLLEIAKSRQLPGDFAEYIDVESGLKRVAGNEAVFLRLLKLFLDNGEAKQLKEQTDKGDLAGAALTAHGIKGMAGNLALTKMHESMTRFEGQLKQGVIDNMLKDEIFAVAARSEEYVRILVGNEG